MIAAIVTGCYALAWLAAARWLYGRWRGNGTGERECRKHGTAEHRRLSYQRRECCYDAAPGADGANAAIAMAVAVLWPLVLFTAAVRFKPRPTAMEQQEASERLTARVAELESELGIKP
jgi:hypothetical protein